jgi:signal transduction histidine kinase
MYPKRGARNRRVACEPGSAHFHPAIERTPSPGSERLIDAVAHELKQPLTAILLTAQAGVRMIDSRAPLDTSAMRGLLMEIIEIDKRASAAVWALSAER